MIGQQRERFLKDSQLGACRRVAGRPALAERAQRFGERLVGQFRADKIDRSPEQDLDACIARTPGSLGREPCLADARLAGHEDGRTAARLRCFEHVRELPQLCCTSDERPLRAGLHAASIARLAPGEKTPVSIPLPADRWQLARAGDS